MDPRALLYHHQVTHSRIGVAPPPSLKAGFHCTNLEMHHQLRQNGMGNCYDSGVSSYPTLCRRGDSSVDEWTSGRVKPTEHGHNVIFLPRKCPFVRAGEGIQNLNTTRTLTQG